MEVSDYQKAIQSGTDNPEVLSALIGFEKQLAGSLLRVVVRGKKGREVPILLTRDTRAGVDVLMESRYVVGVCYAASRYVFANTLSTDDRPLRGCDCLRKVAHLSGVKNPGSVCIMPRL